MTATQVRGSSGPAAGVPVRRRRRWLLSGVLAAVTAAAALVAGGCGGSSAPANPKAAAVAQITANWQKFFNGGTPAATKVSLVTNGQAFASIINAQAASALAKSTSAKVTAVKLSGLTAAAVTYNILLAGKPALPDQHGIALLQGGVWKVAASSFCSLLGLEGQNPPACVTK